MARSLGIVFLGNDRWSVPSLRALAGSDHRLDLVVTRVPKPAGRGSELTPTHVAKAAREADLPLLEVDSVKEGRGFDAMAASAPDVLAVVAYGEILPIPVLQLATVAAVNLHFSLLPRLRGASPVQTSLLEGAEETGVTTIVMDAGMDTGPVLLQRPERVRPDDDAGTLGDRLADLGAKVLVETLDLLARDGVEPRPQDAGATFTKPIRAEDRTLRWEEPARSLVNRVRAMAPDPGVTTRFRAEPLKVLRADVAEAAGEPGTIVSVARDGFVVATGDGGFLPVELAPAGRRRMRVVDFVNGYRPEVGERLG